MRRGQLDLPDKPDGVPRSGNGCPPGVLPAATPPPTHRRGRARCRQCAGEVTLDQPFGRCGCGCTDLEWLAGEELKVKEMEVV